MAFDATSYVSANPAPQEPQGPEVQPAPVAEPQSLRQIGSMAFSGIAGDFVKLIEAETEADPDVMLIQFLVMAGCLLGRKAFVEISGREHHANLNMCVVGASGSGRKGTANDAVRLLFRAVDEEFMGTKVVGGMSTGEGLRDPIRDASYEMVRDKQTGDFRQEVKDPGEPDKRLLVYESEFAVPLVCMTREGNTLSQAIRQAFDGEDLQNLTKRDKTRATHPHVSIVGNITQDELLKNIQAGTDIVNGFANRFLWVYAKKRTKLLPSGGNLLTLAKSRPFLDLVARFNRIYHKVLRPTVLNNGIDLVAANGYEGSYSVIQDELTRDHEATLLWGTDDGEGGMYRELENAGHTGRLADVTKRSSVMVMRLALIYALLDEGAVTALGPRIAPYHLQAAHAVWKYCEESAKFIFSANEVTDPVAGKILEALRTNNGNGMSATRISKLFGGNTDKEKLESAKALLASRRLIRVQPVPKDGGG